MSILTIALVVVVAIVLLAGTFAPLGVFGWWAIRDTDPVRPRVWVLSAVVSFCSIVFGIWLIAQTGGDGSEHCGAGTRYVSETHVVGKTIVTDWECVAP